MEIQNKSGLVVGLIMGIGSLIVLTIVVMVIVSTVDSAQLLRSTGTTNTFMEQKPINGTGTTLAGWYSSGYNWNIVSVVNATGAVTIPSSNYTFNTATGVIKNTTATTYMLANITVSYNPKTIYENSSSNLSDSFTTGIGNVSSKIPTILLIGAVVLLFGVIVLLVMKSREMGISTGAGGGSL